MKLTLPAGQLIPLTAALEGLADNVFPLKTAVRINRLRKTVGEYADELLEAIAPAMKAHLDGEISMHSGHKNFVEFTKDTAQWFDEEIELVITPVPMQLLEEVDACKITPKHLALLVELGCISSEGGS